MLINVKILEQAIDRISECTKMLVANGVSVDSGALAYIVLWLGRELNLAHENPDGVLEHWRDHAPQAWNNLIKRVSRRSNGPTVTVEDVRRWLQDMDKYSHPVVVG